MKTNNAGAVNQPHSGAVDQPHSKEKEGTDKNNRKIKPVSGSRKIPDERGKHSDSSLDQYEISAATVKPQTDTPHSEKKPQAPNMFRSMAKKIANKVKKAHGKKSPSDLKLDRPDDDQEKVIKELKAKFKSSHTSPEAMKKNTADTARSQRKRPARTRPKDTPPPPPPSRTTENKLNSRISSITRRLEHNNIQNTDKNRIETLTQELKNLKQEINETNINNNEFIGKINSKIKEAEKIIALPEKSTDTSDRSAKNQLDKIMRFVNKTLSNKEKMSSDDISFLENKETELKNLESKIKNFSITTKSLKEELDKIQQQVVGFEPFFAKINRIETKIKNGMEGKQGIPPIEELSNALDTQDLETLKTLSSTLNKKTHKAMISLINSKVLKKALIEHINNGREGLFRKPGAKTKIDNLKDHINKNELIANGQDDSLLNDADLLASHVKSILRDTYQIKGTSVESYTKVIKEQDGLKNKLIFIDYVDAIYEFCQHEKRSENRENELDMNGIAISLGLSLWGLAENITTTDGMKNMVQASAEEKINNFLNNWPIAKQEMLLK